MSDDARCRCHSRRPERRCCGPLHAGRPAESPAALMRSRYAAYAKGNADYIIATTEPGGPMWEPDLAAFRASIEAFCSATRFVGLDVVDAPPPTDDEGYVTFRADLVQAGRPVTLEERSRFVRRDGVWRYHSGAPPTRSAT